MTCPFDDPRHRRSEELVFDGEKAERSGDLVRAAALYEEAGELELEFAQSFSDMPIVSSISRQSAESIFLAKSRVSQKVQKQRVRDSLARLEEQIEKYGIHQGKAGFCRAVGNSEEMLREKSRAALAMECIYVILKELEASSDT